jgi:hypothetical protein
MNHMNGKSEKINKISIHIKMPKKSKKDEPCYTRTSKSGKKYVTCEGSQKREQGFQKHLKDLLSVKPKVISDKPKVPVELQGNWR